MVADFLRDPQAHPLPDPPIQGLTMVTPDNGRLLTDEELAEFVNDICQPDEGEPDAEGNDGSEADRSKQGAANDE